MAETCPKCGAAMTFEVVRNYDEEGWPIMERQAHDIGGANCLTRQLAQRDDRIRVLEAENERLKVSVEIALEELNDAKLIIGGISTLQTWLAGVTKCRMDAMAAEKGGE